MNKTSKLNTGKILTLLFFIAFGIRIILFAHVMDHPAKVLQPDSRIYISLAQGLKQYGVMSHPENSLQPDTERMPGYPIFLTLILLLCGQSYLSVVLFQIFIDSLSCVLIYLLGERIWNRIGFLSGLLAAINVNMITYSHFILNDSLFLFVFLISLVAIQRFLSETKWKYVSISGVFLGLSALIRPVVVYLPLLVMPFLFAHLIMHQSLPLYKAAAKGVLFGICLMILISPWLIRNYIYYGRFKLTSQTGEHLLQYVVPMVWQYSKDLSFIEGMEKLGYAVDDVRKAEGIDLEKFGPFENSDFQKRIAIDYLKKERPRYIIQAWVYGMAKNLFAPASIDLSYLLCIERPHFFYTKGNTLVEQGWNFIQGIRDNTGWFGWAVIGSLVFTCVARVIQLWGFFLLFRKKKWEALICLVIISYFLIVSGPVGYAKYRLPFEPVLIVLLAIGLKDLYGRIKGRSSEI